MAEFVVLGARGQLGSEVVRLLPAEATAAFPREQLDITDFLRVAETLRSLRPRCVFNCAASCGWTMPKRCPTKRGG
jgi:dTDP-4-dehydrorhamnose reductase